MWQFLHDHLHRGVQVYRGLILTVDGQLHHQLVIVGRGTIELVLHGSFVLVSKHLGAVAAHFELGKVSL